jgi:ribosomal protein L22
MAEDYRVHDGKKKEETKIVETPKEETKKEKKKEKPEKQSKNEAVVNGKDLAIGRKHAVAICDFIRNKDIDVAIKDLEDVTKYKRAVPMKGEIPHRHDMHQASGSGRYPVKGAKIYIALLKSLKANALVNELELEKFKIYVMPNRASRPYKRFGQGRMKRSHVLIKLIPKNNNKSGGKE